MSETSARANRLAFWFGSFARNGLIGARRAGVGAPPGAGTAPIAGGFGAALAGAPTAPGADAGRCGNAGMSAVFVAVGAIGGALDTVGLSGDGEPPFAGPTLGPARPDAAPAGGADGGTNGGRDDAGAPAGFVARGAPLAGGVPPAGCGGRWAGTPSGAVGTVAADAGTKGRDAGGGAPPARFPCTG